MCRVRSNPFWTTRLAWGRDGVTPVKLTDECNPLFCFQAGTLVSAHSSSQTHAMWHTRYHAALWLRCSRRVSRRISPSRRCPSVPLTLLRRAGSHRITSGKPATALFTLIESVLVERSHVRRRRPALSKLVEDWVESRRRDAAEPNKSVNSVRMAAPERLSPARPQPATTDGCLRSSTSSTVFFGSLQCQPTQGSITAVVPWSNLGPRALRAAPTIEDDTKRRCS